MIKDILLRLEGADTDCITLDAAAKHAGLFDAHVTGLLIDVIPSLIPENRRCGPRYSRGR
ncbi:MAG: hypothetical protein ACLQKK_20465 [Rhodomicrobium sp.]